MSFYEFWCQFQSRFCCATLFWHLLLPKVWCVLQPIADRVAQHLEIISTNFQFSTRRTRILMGFIIHYLVLIVNPMGRILLRWKRFRNNLEMLCHPICNWLCQFLFIRLSHVIYVKQSFYSSIRQVHSLQTSKFSHVPHVSVNESCPTYEWVFPFEKLKRSIHVKNMNESCSTHKRIIPHVQKRLSTREMERRIHVEHMKESYSTHERIISHVQTSLSNRAIQSHLHVPHMNEGVMFHT